MPYKALLIDFFGVVCSEVAPYWLAKHFSVKRAAEIKMSLIRSADVGTITQAAMFEQLSELSNIPAEQIERNFEGLVQLNRDVIDFVAAARRFLKIGLVTNSPSPFVRGILDRHRLGILFDAIVISSEIRTAKPDRQIYDVIIAKLDVSPAEVVFVDDNPVNVEKAVELGMGGVVFESLDNLRKNLSLT